MSCRLTKAVCPTMPPNHCTASGLVFGAWASISICSRPYFLHFPKGSPNPNVLFSLRVARHRASPCRKPRECGVEKYDSILSLICSVRFKKSRCKSQLNLKPQKKPKQINLTTTKKAYYSKTSKQLSTPWLISKPP